MAYLRLSTLKTQLGITDATSDAELSGLLLASEYAIARYLGYDPSPAITTEYYDGNGTPYLPLRRTPVQAISSVYLDDTAEFNATGAFASATLLTLGTDYTTSIDDFGNCKIIRMRSVWPLRYERQTGRLSALLHENPGCIKVTYTAGEINPVIAAAGLAEAKAMWSMRANGIGSMLSESLDGRSISLTQLNLNGGRTPRFVSGLAEMMLSSLRRIPMV